MLLSLDKAVPDFYAYLFLAKEYLTYNPYHYVFSTGRIMGHLRESSPNTETYVVHGVILLENCTPLSIMFKFSHVNRCRKS